MQTTVISIVIVDMGYHSARTDIGMPVSSAAFARTLTSSLTPPSKPEEGQRAEGLEERCNMMLDFA